MTSAETEVLQLFRTVDGITKRDPLRIWHQLRAWWVTRKLKGLIGMSAPLSLSLSADPVSQTMNAVIACLTYLETPAGQQLAINFNNVMGTITVNFAKFIHISLPAPDILDGLPGSLSPSKAIQAAPKVA